MSETNITPGNYSARAINWHWDTPKSGTGMCLALMLRVESGPHAGAEVRGTLYFDTERVDAKGRTAADRSIDALRSMGLRGELDTIDENAGGLDAGTVSIVVETNDKGYPFAKYINPASSFSAFAPPPADAKRAFFAQMKARTRAAEQGARASGTTPRSPAAPQRNAPPPKPTGFASQESADDDIPF